MKKAALKIVEGSEGKDIISDIGLYDEITEHLNKARAFVDAIYSVDTAVVLSRETISWVLSEALFHLDKAKEIINGEPKNPEGSN